MLGARGLALPAAVTLFCAVVVGGFIETSAATSCDNDFKVDLLNLETAALVACGESNADDLSSLSPGDDIGNQGTLEVSAMSTPLLSKFCGNFASGQGPLFNNKYIMSTVGLHGQCCLVFRLFHNHTSTVFRVAIS